MRTRTASAPRAAARCDAAIVARVDSRPVPTMSTRSRGTESRAAAITCSASSSSTKGASPFEPSATTPPTPAAIHFDDVGGDRRAIDVAVAVEDRGHGRKHRIEPHGSERTGPGPEVSNAKRGSSEEQSAQVESA